MLTQLPGLPEDKAGLSDSQRKQLAGVVSVIVKATSPEKIVCFGSRSTIAREWGCFMPEDGPREPISAAYYLLIIIPAGENRAEYEIIQMIEQHTKRLHSQLIYIVHKLPAVNEAIEKGSRFFTTVCNKGILLFDGNGQPLSQPKELLTAAIKQSMEESWSKWFEMAERFYQSATHSLQNGWNEQCVFLLHQSVEHGCMALLTSIIGYRCHTHNLSRLLALTGSFSLLPSAIFPQNNKEEMELFNLLRIAYSEARYNGDYIIPAETATILAERVKRLLDVAEQLYREKLNSLNAKPAILFPITLNDVAGQHNYK